MHRSLPAAAVLAVVCAAGLAGPAQADGTSAASARGPVTAAPAPPLCTPEQEDQGAADDTAAKDCHALRAASVAKRAVFYANHALEVRDPNDLQDAADLTDIQGTVQLAQAAAELAQDASDAAVRGPRSPSGPRFRLCAASIARTRHGPVRQALGRGGLEPVSGTARRIGSGKGEPRVGGGGVPGERPRPPPPTGEAPAATRHGPLGGPYSLQRRACVFCHTALGHPVVALCTNMDAGPQEPVPCCFTSVRGHHRDHS